VGDPKNMATQYTKEIEEDIYITYGENKSMDTISALSDKYGIPRRSIISKLVACGIYKKQTYVKKNLTTKGDHIESLAHQLDIDVSILDSMEKVTKYALVIMDQRVRVLKDEIENLSQELKSMESTRK
jgi:hypothetical protein